MGKIYCRRYWCWYYYAVLVDVGVGVDGVEKTLYLKPGKSTKRSAGALARGNLVDENGYK